MQVDKISETLYKFTLAINEFSVNVGVCTGVDGILLIDTGWDQTADEIYKRLRKLDDGIVKLIILTHHHGDHIGGRRLLGENATLIAHKNTRDELAGKYFGLDALPGQELPIIMLENELSLRFNGEDIKIIPAPGHTDSDLIVYFVTSSVVYMGDLIFSDSYPALFPSWGGDTNQYITSIGALIEMFPEDVKLIAGHGRDYSLDDLREHHRMAVSTTGLIKQGIADGKNVQAMLEEDILRDWTKWSSPQITTENWITQAYESLTGQGKKSISEPLSSMIIEVGIKAAIEHYHEIKKNQPDAYNLGENELNTLGYQLLWRNMNEAAIEVFKLNTQVYPKSANPYDSLGEAYLASGDEKHAIENYEKALSLNPDMPSAVAALEELRPKSED